MNFEYYYNKLSSMNKAPEQELIGSHKNGEELEEENSKEVAQDGSTEDMEEIDDFSPKNFSETFKDILEKNPDLAEEIKKSPDFADLGDELKEHMPVFHKLGERSAGKKEEFKKLDEKPTFKKLMKLLVPKKKDINDPTRGPLDQRWHGSGSGGSRNIAYGETPAGVIDGVNDTFTLIAIPNPSNSLILALNGQVLARTVDYTITGNTITLNTPPQNIPDAVLRAIYYEY